jgi:phosphate transport system permease protein
MTDETLNRSLLSDAEGGVVVDNAWYSFSAAPFGRSVLAASLTLMLVILPIIVIASQEALRAVPVHRFERGASRDWAPPAGKSSRNVTLPAAIPGIMTGCHFIDEPGDRRGPLRS